MITNEHPELLRARSVLEMGRVMTKWHPSDDPRRSGSGVPFCEVVSGGFYAGTPIIGQMYAMAISEDVAADVPTIKYSPTAKEAAESWLKSALEYACSKVCIEWRIEPEIEDCPEGWAVYSRFAVFRKDQLLVWSDALATLDEPACQI